MEIKYKTSVLKRIEGIEQIIMFPDQPTFYFETGIRRSIAVIPEWTTWKAEIGEPEEIYHYEVICVYRSFESSIEKHGFSVDSIGAIIQEKGNKLSSLAYFIGNADFKYDGRTREQFMVDYNTVVNEHKILLNESI